MSISGLYRQHTKSKDDDKRIDMPCCFYRYPTMCNDSFQMFWFLTHSIASFHEHLEFLSNWCNSKHRKVKFENIALNVIWRHHPARSSGRIASGSWKPWCGQDNFARQIVRCNAVNATWIASRLNGQMNKQRRKKKTHARTPTCNCFQSQKKIFRIWNVNYYYRK